MAAQLTQPCLGYWNITHAIPLVYVVVASLIVSGGSLGLLAVLFLLYSLPTFAAFIRNEFRRIRTTRFDAATQAAESPALTDGIRQALPDVTRTALVAAAFIAGQLILVEATLNFLGLGVQPPWPTWGYMFRDNVTLTPGFSDATLVAFGNRDSGRRNCSEQPWRMAAHPAKFELAVIPKGWIPSLVSFDLCRCGGTRYGRGHWAKVLPRVFARYYLPACGCWPGAGLDAGTRNIQGRTMIYRNLGRTGQKVSLLSYGTGGPSGFGARTGVDRSGRRRLIRTDAGPRCESFRHRGGLRKLRGVARRRLTGHDPRFVPHRHQVESSGHFSR